MTEFAAVIGTKEGKTLQQKIVSPEADVLLKKRIGEAVLGDEIEVPSIDSSKAMMTIPPGTASETVFRMKGKGLPDLQHGTVGDQFVKVRVEVPKKLTKKQKDLISQLGEEKPSKNFLKRVFGS